MTESTDYSEPDGLSSILHQDPLHTQDLSSRLGRAMLFAAWVVGLAVLVLFFQRQLDDRENPNRISRRPRIGRAGVG